MLLALVGKNTVLELGALRTDVLDEVIFTRESAGGRSRCKGKKEANLVLYHTYLFGTYHMADLLCYWMLGAADEQRHNSRLT